MKRAARKRAARTSSRAPAAADDEQTTAAASAPPPAPPPEFEWVDWRALRPWPGNPKTYTDAEVAELLESVKVNGWGRPGVANRYPGLEGEIIEGHRSRLVAEALGETVAQGAPGPFLMPMRWVYLPPKRAHALALALAAARIPKSELDQERLTAIVRSHELDPGDWMAAGFEEQEVKALMFDPWPEEAKPRKGVKLDTTFKVVIECNDEPQQTAILEWAQDQGLKCRALI